MLLLASAEDEYVVQVDRDKVVQVGAQHVVHGSLEGSRRIAEAKWHDLELILAVAGPEGCLGHVFRRHAKLMVARVQVELGVVTGST